MNMIRKATSNDLARIAEIFIFNYRLYFYPIFRNDDFYFAELQVPAMMEQMKDSLGRIWVYDDGTVKGFIETDGSEVRRLFVEPVLQGQKIGSALLTFAIDEQQADTLWALEKNTRAIRFYARLGFHVTTDRKPEPETDEFLVRVQR